jgi:hypothetical protein
MKAVPNVGTKIIHVSKAIIRLKCSEKTAKIYDKHDEAACFYPST